jgi:hypothetical protein
MNSPSWSGLRKEAKGFLEQRDYSTSPLSQRVARSGAAASELAKLASNADERRGIWIPGFEIFPVTTVIQRHRGTFSELARTVRDALVKLGSGRNNGRPRSYTPGPLKDFTCTHPAYRKIARLRIGSSPYTGNWPRLRCIGLTIRNNGTLCIFFMTLSLVCAQKVWLSHSLDADGFPTP